MDSEQAVRLVLRPSNEGVIQTFLPLQDGIRTGSWLVRDAGGSRTHFKLLCRQPPDHQASASLSDELRIE